MNFTRTDNADETILRIEGALDALTAPQIRPTIDKLVGEKLRRVTVDVSAVEFIDSSGVAVIVALFKRIRGNGGDCKVVGAKDQPLAIFKLLRMDRVLFN
jgi:anti-sigma B factor antagonist